MATKKKKSSGKGSNKTFASKRTVNPPQTSKKVKGETPEIAGFQPQDALRRLGDFEGRGQHARTGNRGHQ